MDRQYVILNENKEPTHKFKNGGKPWDEVKNELNLALIVPKGFVVLDFDTESDAKIIKDIVNGMNLPVRMMQTTRGVHVWFRSPEGEEIKNGIKQRLAIGIYSDRKAGGRNAYVKIRDDGKNRPWIKATAFEDLMILPRWLRPVMGIREGGFDFKALGEGDGRNQKLFNYIVYLQSKGFSREDIRSTIRVINDYVFSSPLDGEEMDKILRDESFKPEEEIAAEREERKQNREFKHNDFGDELISMYHIITYNGMLYVYEDGYYQADERIIEQKMLEVFPSIKQRQRAEVLAYIRIKTHIPAGDLRFDPWTVNLKSGRFDLRTKVLSEHTPDAIEFDRIPVDYDPEAYCPALDGMLDKVFCHDEEVRKLFEEMVGYALMRHANYQKAFMFYGAGSNGKSTILDLIKSFLGKHNFVSIDIRELTKNKFDMAELENKLANIGDDINDSAIDGTGILKKLFSGNSMQVQRKGERPFQLEPYATHIYSCNDIPRSVSDKTFGFYRRWSFIPLKAKFSINDADYDPLIKDKIVTPDALSYLFNLAVQGAQRLIQNNGFTEPKVVSETLEAYKVDNSSTLSWVDESEISREIILEKSSTELYSDFSDWCKLSGVKSTPSRKTFCRELRDRFDLDANMRQGKNGKRYFRVSLD
jgi:putative DNA primase/helicase